MTEGKFIHKKYLTQILYDAKTLFDKEKTLKDIFLEKDSDIEITIVGDIHGQYYDLINLFELNGIPSKKSLYIFNGNFVNRGSFSVETAITLICWKILYPNHFFITRGNQECREMTRLYGFKAQVRNHYDEFIFEIFSILFCSLPLCYVINKKIFVIHGGLFSKNNITLDELRELDRNQETPKSGVLCECIWSDPCNDEGVFPGKMEKGIKFGPDVTSKFLKLNGLEMIVRSHEFNNEGYRECHDGKVVTVYSSPNFCDQMGNVAAFVKFNGAEMKPVYKQYSHVHHPSVLPLKNSIPWMMI